MSARCERRLPSGEQCTEPARWFPRVELRAKPGAAPASYAIGLRLCDAHRDLGPSQILADEAWASLSRVFERARGATLRRELSTVRYEALDSPLADLLYPS